MVLVAPTLIFKARAATLWAATRSAAAHPTLVATPTHDTPNPPRRTRLAQRRRAPPTQGLVESYLTGISSADSISRPHLRARMTAPAERAATAKAARPAAASAAAMLETTTSPST